LIRLEVVFVKNSSLPKPTSDYHLYVLKSSVFLTVIVVLTIVLRNIHKSQLPNW